MSTMILDAKKKRLKQENDALKAVGQRAIKQFGQRGEGYEVILPAAELAALEIYVSELQRLRGDLDQKWGAIPEYSRNTLWLSAEISAALKRIVKLNIELVDGSSV